MISARLPGPLRWAVRLLALEALLVGVLTGWFVVGAVAGAPAHVADALALAGFVGLLAAALAGLAFGLARRRPRARAPAIVLQLMLVMLGYVLSVNGLPWVGIPGAAVAVVVATLLLTPTTHGALEHAVDGSGQTAS